MSTTLQQLDLNLLTVLDALLETRSVSRAAEALHLTQSAVSNALARLRQLLGDPLLVRGRGGMVPTETALRLIEPVREALDNIREAVEQAQYFDPAQVRAEVHLAVPDQVTEIFLPALVRRLRERAPGLVLGVRHLPMMPGEAVLACSENHLVFCNTAVQSDAIHSARLFSEPRKLLARRDHPQIRGRLTLDAYCALPHAIAKLVTVEGRTQVDDLLADMGRKRRLAVMVGRPMPIVDRDTDFVATQPESMARTLAAKRGLTVHDLPFDLPPEELFLAWHRKYDGSALQQWLRQQIIEHFATLRPRVRAA